MEEPSVGIFERYTEKARQTIVLAKHEADGFGSLEVGTEHILLALLRDPALISSTMEAVSEAEIRAAIRAYIPPTRTKSAATRLTTKHRRTAVGGFGDGRS
jgi:ATP-dependent Clp protease ATP-binding subunit ClpA